MRVDNALVYLAPSLAGFSDDFGVAKLHVALDHTRGTGATNARDLMAGRLGADRPGHP